MHYPLIQLKLTNVGGVGRLPCHYCLQHLTLELVYVVGNVGPNQKCLLRQKVQSTFGLLFLTSHRPESRFSSSISDSTLFCQGL
jgi:hypothetical protein